MRNKIILFLFFTFISTGIYSSEKGISNKFSLIYDTSGVNNDNVNKKPKSVSRAMLLSLAVPGLGERYVDSNKLSKYLIVSEATWWSLFTWHSVYGGWIEEDYKTFAVAHAGIDLTGKDKKYFVNIGNFIDIYGYNQKKRLDRYDDLVYENISAYFWRWDSDSNRQRFEDMRIKRDRYNNRINYFVTGIILNHIISGINAGISADRWNKSLEPLSRLKLEYISNMSYSMGNIDIGAKLSFRF